MIGEKFGHFLDQPLRPLVRLIPFSPNQLTLIGFGLTLVAAVVLTHDFLLGGLLILIGALFDLVDGMVARERNCATCFGAFLDSLLDRYADAALLLGIGYHYHHLGETVLAAVAVLTLIGGLLVSYARARAEAMGLSCKVGIAERPERILLLAGGCLLNQVPAVLWILLVLTHVTVAQRTWTVWKQAGGN